MGVFDEDQQTALELITEFGEEAQLTVMTTVEGPTPWDPDVPASTTTVARMVFLNFSSQSNSTNTGERYFEGSLIETGDKKVLLAALGLAIAPDVGALITRADGSVWDVVQLKGLDPNGQQILYTMQARQ